MTILVRSSLRKLDVNVPLVTRCVNHMLKCTDYPKWDLGIQFTGTQKIQTLNRTYRKKDAPTDILSFNAAEVIAPGLIKVREDGKERDLGDLVVCVAYVEKQCKMHDWNFDQRMRVLIVHGVCHLIGYDHEKQKEYKIMKTQEDRILKDWENILEQKGLILRHWFKSKN